MIMRALRAQAVRTSRRSSPTSAGTIFSCSDHACAACSGGSDESPEFSDICRYYFGRVGEYVSVAFSLIALLGAAVVYWVLMSNFLYHSVKFMYGASRSQIYIVILDHGSAML